MGIKTYRLRLTLMYTAAFVLVYLFFSMTFYYEYKGAIYEAVDTDLLNSAKAAAKEKPRDILSPDAGSRHEEIITKFGDEYYQLVSGKGGVTISSSKNNLAWPLNRELLEKAFQGVPQFDVVSYRGEPFRVLYFLLDSEHVLRIGESIGRLTKETSEIQRLGLFFLPPVFLLSGLMSWVLAGRSLSPVIKIRLLAERIRQGKMNERINIGLKGKEIDDLVTIFNDMLEALQRAMDAQKRFTSDVSHEIRAPLTSLRGTIEVALRRPRAASEYQEVLSSNLEDINRLSRITDNLLLLSRADNNIFELRKQWFEIDHLLDGVVERLTHKAMEAKVPVIREYGEHIELYGDVDLLDQAFTNLVDNAIKYSLPEGKVTVSISQAPSATTVTISDTGIGIPEEDIPHIFERFYRVSKERSRKSGGTGLGLSITQWIIHAHGGNIVVRSEKNVGSSFVVVIPNRSD